MRLQSVCLSLVGLLLCAAPRAETRFDTCRDPVSPAGRTSCLADRLSDRPFDRRVLAETGTLAVSHPELALELIGLLQQRFDPERHGPAIEARLLELRAEARLALGDTTAAASDLLAAIELDDGVTRLTWFASDTRDRTIPLDTGSGRLRRAARALAADGRLDEARTLLSRAGELGDRSWVGQPWVLEVGSPTLPAPVPLMAGAWYKPLPQFEVEHFDGSPFELESVRGKVFALDFWATWCAPCIAELPHMQSLYDTNRERGFSVLAINVGEPPEVAIPFARELELTLPLAVYHAGLDETFEAKALPAVILVDRLGRIRQRWDGYREGMEAQIAETIETLLDETGEVLNEVASVLDGAGRLEVVWSRTVPAPIAGLAVVDTGEGSRVIASSGKWLFLYGPDGRTEEKWTSTQTAGRLVGGRPDDEGRFRLVGFRPGGARLVSFEMPDGEYEITGTAAPVFDAMVLTPAEGDEGPPLTLVAGLDGLRSGASAIESSAELGTVSDLAEDGERGTILALEPGRRLVRLDRSLAIADSRPVPADSWSLIVDPQRPGEAGVAPPVRSFAAGSILDSARRELAVLLESEQLLLLEPAGGEILFRASWPGAVAVAAADLDGDGRDELFVAAGRSLSMLRVHEVQKTH